MTILVRFFLSAILKTAWRLILLAPLTVRTAGFFITILLDLSGLLLLFAIDQVSEIEITSDDMETLGWNYAPFQQDTPSRLS